MKITNKGIIMNVLDIRNDGRVVALGGTAPSDSQQKGLVLNQGYNASRDIIFNDGHSNDDLLLYNGLLSLQWLDDVTAGDLPSLFPYNSLFPRDDRYPNSSFSGHLYLSELLYLNDGLFPN